MATTFYKPGQTDSVVSFDENFLNTPIKTGDPSVTNERQRLLKSGYLEGAPSPSSQPNQNNQSNINQPVSPQLPQTQNQSQISPLEAQIQGDNEFYKAQYNTIINQLDSLKNANDTQLTSLIDSIQRDYTNRQQQMEAVNKARIGSLGVSGIRTGLSRYAPELQSGKISSEEQAGLQRINALENEKQSLISQARVAAEEKNYKILNERMVALRELRNEQRQSLIDQQKMVQEQQAAILKRSNEEFEKQRGQQLQSSILAAINQGFNDPIEILTALDVAGIQATPDEVAKYTNLIQQQDSLAGLDQDLRTYEYLKNNEPDELQALGITNYKDYLRITGDAKRVLPRVSGGGGGGGGGGGTGSSGGGIDYGTPADISTSVNLVDQNGKRIKLTATQVDSVVGFTNALSQLQEAKNLISNNKINTGPIAGRTSEISRLVDMADPKIVELDALLSSMKANFMKAISGAAVSESEVKRLAKFLPSINDTEKNLEIKIKKFEESLAQQKAIYLSTLGAVNKNQAKKETSQGAIKSGTTSSGLKYKIVK